MVSMLREGKHALPHAVSYNLSASGEYPAEFDFVGACEVISYGQARYQPDHVPAERSEQMQLEGGIGFDIVFRGYHGLLDLAVLQAGHELLDAQIVRADPGHRVDRAAEDMVETAVFAGALDGHDVLGLLDHADHRSVAARVLTDGAFGL